MTITDTPGKAFDTISMDILGSMPTTQISNNYILTILVLLTKDTGSNFLSELLKVVTKKFKINHYQALKIRNPMDR